MAVSWIIYIRQAGRRINPKFRHRELYKSRTAAANEQRKKKPIHRMKWVQKPSARLQINNKNMAKGVRIKKSVYRMIFLERPQQRAAIDEQQATCGGANHNAEEEKKNYKQQKWSTEKAFFFESFGMASTFCVSVCLFLWYAFIKNGNCCFCFVEDHHQKGSSCTKYALNVVAVASMKSFLATMARFFFIIIIVVVVVVSIIFFFGLTLYITYFSFSGVHYMK